MEFTLWCDTPLSKLVKFYPVFYVQKIEEFPQPVLCIALHDDSIYDKLKIDDDRLKYQLKTMTQITIDLIMSSEEIQNIIDKNQNAPEETMVTLLNNQIGAYIRREIQTNGGNFVLNKHLYNTLLLIRAYYRKNIIVENEDDKNDLFEFVEEGSRDEVFNYIFDPKVEYYPYYISELYSKIINENLLFNFNEEE